MSDAEREERPKKFEDEKLQAFLDKAKTQTQKEYITTTVIQYHYINVPLLDTY